MQRAPVPPIVLALVLSVLAGCSGPLPPDPTSTSAPTSGVSTNACSGHGAPEIAKQDALSGENAFDYMIGLVCDHSGASPQERHRVPGTAMHRDASRYLHETLDRDSSFSVRYDNFTGSQFQEIMKARQNSSYYRYMTDCAEAEESRVRGLQFSNIEARGGTAGGPIFLLMAHWDSKRFADDEKTAFISANDGPSGVGILLEIARVMSGDALPYEIRILLTDGEDGFDDCHPLAGSTWYAEKQLSQAERARMTSIILLDMVGDSQATFYKGCGSDSALMERIWAKAKDMGVTQFKDQRLCGGVDDHTPFEERGMKSVDIIDTGRPFFTPYWHTRADTPDKVSPSMLGNVGKIVDAVARQPV